MGAFPSTAFVTGATGLLGNHLVRQLGVPFRPVQETLRDTVDWYRQNGWDHRQKVMSSRTRVEIANGQ